MKVKRTQSSARKQPDNKQRGAISRAGQEGRLKRFPILRKSLRLWQIFWAVVGPLIAALGVAWNWKPEVTITSGANLDPQQNLQTQILVTNAGRSSIKHLEFGCAATFPNSPNQESTISMNTLTLRGIDHLGPKSSVSKGCFTESRGVSGALLMFKVWYSWPLLGFRESRRGFFRVEKGANEFFLVPEAEPDPLSHIWFIPLVDPYEDNRAKPPT